MLAFFSVLPAAPDLPPSIASILGLVMLAAAAGVLLIDMALVALWAGDRRRERPILAPRWSLAHVFLGFQGAIALTLAVGGPLSGIVWLALDRFVGRLQPLPETAAFAWAVIPLLVVQNVALAAVVVFFVVGVYRRPLAAAGLSTRRLVPCLALGAAVAVATIPLSDLAERLSALWLARAMPPPWVEIWRQFEQATSIKELLLDPLRSPAGLIALVLVVGIVGPMGEEVFFRGFVHGALRRRFGVAAGVVLSAALFSLVHVSPVGLVPIFLIGVLLAVLYERTGTLAAPFALHAVNNTFAVVVSYFDPDFTFWPFVPVPG